MSSTTETRTLVDEIVDNADERELWITGRLFEHAPYFHAGKGGDTRLAEALRMCLDDKITPQSDGSYQVQGSGGRVYRVAESCSCPASQHAKSRWCKHAVGVAVYVEWQRRIHPAQPVALGTLPLPPATVDARLAQAASVAMDHVYDALPVPMEDRLALGMLHDQTALQTHHTPQEDRMPDDAYLPEPDELHTPVAIVERQAPEPARVTAAVAAGQALLPALDAQNLERSMQAWAEQRQVVKRFLQQELHEGTDYYTLRIKGRETKPALSKAGSEKFMALFQLHASFEQDTATWTMLGQPQGTLCYVCRLHTRSGELIGEGRGARTLQQDGGDINKAVKMASKSAMVDAILRTGALSDVFTQDEESIPGATVEPDKAATPAKPTSQELRQRIWHMAQAQAPEARTREAVEAWVLQETGYALHPDHYRDIVESLAVRA